MVNGQREPCTSECGLGKRRLYAQCLQLCIGNQTRHFDNLTDGTIGRRQAFRWVAAEQGPAWIIIEFPQRTEIDRIVFRRGNSIPVNYKLEYRTSRDASWILLSDTTGRLPREDDIRKAEELRLAEVSVAEAQKISKNSALIRAARSAVGRLASGPRVFAASFDKKPDSTWQLSRGDPMQRMQQIEPGIPRVMGDLKLDMAHPEIERRTALAKHLTEPDHPLTARVIVNRV